MNRLLENFNIIKKEYSEFEKSFLKKGIKPMRTTNFGFWAGSKTDDLFEFYKKVNLKKFKHLLDLGSGDGRMVLIASLFTKATGVEVDQELVKISNRLKQDIEKKGVKTECNFICDDFRNLDLSKYDFLISYYDKIFTLEIENKIKNEFKGEFYLYNDIYLPKFLKRGKRIWIGQMPVVRILLD